MKFLKIIVKYLEKFGPWATIWANGPLQFSNSKTGPGLDQNDSAQAHDGPNPKNGFAKARARPGTVVRNPFRPSKKSRKLSYIAIIYLYRKLNLSQDRF